MLTFTIDDGRRCGWTSIAGDIFLFLEDCNVLSLPSRNDGVDGWALIYDAVLCGFDLLWIVLTWHQQHVL